MSLIALALAAAMATAPPAIGPGETCLALRHLGARHAFTGRLDERRVPASSAPAAPDGDRVFLLEVETPLCFPGAGATPFTRIDARGAAPIMTALRAAAGRRVRLTGRIAAARTAHDAPLAMQVESVEALTGLDDE